MTREELERALRTIAATTTVGLGMGFLVGGLGSRLAMRALFLTSGETARGLISDDGFVIGRFSLVDTLGLVVVGTVIGVIGAFVYLAVRPFLIGPRWFRYLTCGLASGAVVGSMLVHAEGVDFTMLGPRWFAIALFVALPALFGLVTPPAVDRAARQSGWFQTASARLALLPLLLLLVPPLPVIVGLPLLVALGAWSIVASSPALIHAAHHRASLWAVRAGWLGIAMAGALALVRDTAALL